MQEIATRCEEKIEILFVRAHEYYVVRTYTYCQNSFFHIFIFPPFFSFFFFLLFLTHFLILMYRFCVSTVHAYSTFFIINFVVFFLSFFLLVKHIFPSVQFFFLFSVFLCFIIKLLLSVRV